MRYERVVKGLRDLVPLGLGAWLVVYEAITGHDPVFLTAGVALLTGTGLIRGLSVVRSAIDEKTSP